jgi:hypothetical protein
VNIALATLGFASPGGSETYVLTVAEQLQRLGHGVTILVGETGPMSEFAADRGLTVTADLGGLRESCDALVVQDSALAYRLADLYPGTPQLFRAASDLYDLQLPPSLPGVVSDVVACSERVRRRVRHLAVRHRIHRLRQPIDTERFMPAGAPAARPRRALLLGNYLRGRRLDAIQAALERRGVTCQRVGALGELTCAPEQAIWAADLVVAKGRAALEAMACGKPVLVYDQFGGDGWVTAERYDAMEADNFAGLSAPVVLTGERLDEELAAYHPDMGTVNRELTTMHHGARAHVAQLCELLERADPPVATDGAPLRELARLVRLQWRGEMRALSFQEASRRAQAEAEHARAELATERAAHAAEISGLAAELARTRGDHEASIAELWAELERLRAVAGTRRVRLGIRLGQLADTARGRVPGQ